MLGVFPSYNVTADRARQAELDILPALQQFSILFCVFGRTKTDRISIGPNVGTASVLFLVSRSNAAHAARAAQFTIAR